ncbi:MDR family NADP-dependent oxidoreductase [Actinacidiphila guanduensis]|uniref:Enoyl reductase (ER) domain-containing protein n=1 Tax=Actinacidiphila guanduensis TaxID=310781 RepID=A0A1H0NRB6_9ACTN|nr:NADP-dependent oxidoreductase [Actinacidiphila guanduensis]SDO94985.1 hypothetical protein/2-alkenal reductase [Actinacidiphila guanduensis]
MTLPPSLPALSREVRLVARPRALPAPEHFAVAEVPLQGPAPGHVLVRNRYFLVFPGLRTLMGEESAGVPLPPLRPGDTVFGPAVGEVVVAPPGGQLRAGDRVMHLRGWREYAEVAAGECVPLGGELPEVAYLNQGVAAYGALTRLAAVRTGDVVLVTGAAGAVGSMAGQIARLLGAGRVIGTTGSPRKAERLTGELGYDAVVLRGSGSFADRLTEAAPDGIDVLLDTVAGEQLTAAVAAARPGARFALVGALSGQLSARRAGGSAPTTLDAYRLVIQGVSLRGYRGTDHPDVPAEWTRHLATWLRTKAITFPHTLIPGLTDAPQALQDLLKGAHFGPVIVQLP